MKNLLISITSVLVLYFGFSVMGYAATNIDANYPNYYAWNDEIGWIDFKSSGTVNLSKTILDGYAQIGPVGGLYGYISLNCLTGPTTSNCSPISYNVTNDSAGNLSGWAWSDSIGWISFDCHNPQTGGVAPDYSCAASPYQVKVNGSGEFTGYAWNDAIGWISFNCNQASGSTCSTVDYRVKTAWIPGSVKGSLISGTFDTGQTTGAAFNYIVWRGALNGGKVYFQLATSNCSNGATDAPSCLTNIGWGDPKTSGDGAFLGPGGTPGTPTTPDAYSSVGPDVPIKLVNQSVQNNKRYFRYKVYIETDITQSTTPIVQDIIVNWSP